jgi:transcriptional regulator with XRE-family HTH domain
MEVQGISRAELARRMGKPRSNITRLLSGNQNFSILLLAEIASALGVSIKTEFIREEECQVVEINKKRDNRKIVVDVETRQQVV